MVGAYYQRQHEGKFRLVSSWSMEPGDPFMIPSIYGPMNGLVFVVLYLLITFGHNCIAMAMVL